MRVSSPMRLWRSVALLCAFGVTAEAWAQTSPDEIPPEPSAPPPAPEAEGVAPPAPPPAPEVAPAPQPPAPPEAPEAQTDLLAPPPAPLEPVGDSDGIDARILFGGIALAVGGAAVLAGSAVAIVAAVRYAELDCPNDVCTPAEMDEGEKYNDLRIPAGAAIVAGNLVAFVGAMFLISGTSDEHEITLELAPTGFGLRGRF